VKHFKYFCLVLALCALPLAVLAEAPPSSPLQIEGDVAQGGFLRGTVPPGTRVRSNGSEVPVTSSGAFVIPIARDAAPWLTVTAFFADGTSDQRKLTVATRAWDIQRIDGLPQNQVTPSQSDLIAIREEQKKIADSRAKIRDSDAFMQSFLWPVVGTITGIYGSQRILNGEPRAPHLGIDIAAAEGTPIKAPADGVVTLATRNLFFNGNLVILDHGLGVTTAFAHLAQIRVISGQTVHRGDIIGTLGKSGRTTGPNLHFGVNVRGVGVDPGPILGSLPEANNTAGTVELKR